MILLYDWIVILLLIRLDLTQPQYLIPWILFLHRLYLTIIHMIDYNNLLLHKIHSYLSNLFLRRLFRILLKLSRHLLNTHLTHMIVIIIWVLSRVHLILISLYKCHALRHQPIICIAIQLNRLLTYLLYTPDKSIRISVVIVFDNSHPTVHFCYLFPVRHLSWTIVFHSFELVWITVFSLELVASMLEKISHLLYLYLFVVL